MRQMGRRLREMFAALREKGPRAKWTIAYLSVPTLLWVASIALWSADPPFLKDFRRRVFDRFQAARPRAYRADVPVRIIDIDDASLQRLGQWPWPRSLVAKLVRRLGELGAGVVVFDVVFAEPDRTSPARMAERLPPSAARARELLKGLPDHDQLLAEAFAGTAVVSGYTLTSQKNGVRPELKAGFLFSSKSLDKTPRSYIPEGFAGAVVSLPILQQAAAGNGSFSFRPDPGGVIRRIPLMYRIGEDLYPSLAAEALRVAVGAEGYKVMASGGSGTLGLGAWSGIERMMIGPLKIPTDRFGNVLLYDTGHRPERYIPVWEILESGFDRSRIEGMIAFVGTSAAGLQDIRSTPLSPVIPGVEVHAQLAEQVLLQEFLRRPAWSQPAEIGFLVFVGLLLMLLMPRLGAAWCAAIFCAAAASAFGLSWRLFTEQRLLLDPVYPSLSVLVIYLSSSLINYLRTEAERKQVRGAFSRYMSPALVEQLAKDPSRLRLGGEKRDMTLMFSDIRGFTTISEQFTAEGLTHFINLYLTPMTGIVLEKGGTIDKYMGDCIMAFWNAPLDDSDHVRNACEAALEMTRRLGELNVEWEAEAKKYGSKFIPIRAGIGLNTGECCVGNMGSEQRFDYSVLGDAVNLASRLEGQSKTYGVDIVLGPATREAAQDFATVELDLIKVKGKTVPVHIYVLLGGADRGADPKFREFAGKHAEMISAYRARNWDRAGELMAECRKAEPSLFKLYDLYAERLRACRENPPGKDWGGVFTATSK